MTKREFTIRVKGLLKDVKEGYYGMEEVIDEIWDMIKETEETSNLRWKEIKRLRKRLENVVII